MLCLLWKRSDWTLNVLLESSSPPQPLPLGVFPVTDDEDGALEKGVEGDWRLGGLLDFRAVGVLGEGLLSRRV